MFKVAKVLLIIGGINWGLVGIGMLLGSNWNVVHLILGFSPIIEAIVYILVGVAAVVKIFGCNCHKCAATPEEGMAKPEAVEPKM